VHPIPQQILESYSKDTHGNDPVLKYAAFAYWQAKRVGGVFDSEERLQSALLGLCEAKARYNPDKGSFQQYAKGWIFAKVHQGTYLFTIRKSCKLASKYAMRVSKLYWKRKMHDQELTVNDVVNTVSGITPDQASELLDIVSEAQRMETLKGMLSAQVFDSAADIEMENYQRRQRIRSLLNEFHRSLPNDRDREIFVELVLNLNDNASAATTHSEMPSLSALGTKYGVSKERVRQLRNRISDQVAEFMRANFNPEEY
jgi:RNA polymerase sigma factor (sigma-70 family)